MSGNHPDRPPRYGWQPGREGYKPLYSLFECALYKINLHVTCRRCGHTVIIDGPGCWWDGEQKGQDPAIWKLQKRLCCRKCKEQGRRVRNPDIQQTKERSTCFCGGGPTVSEWKRIVNRQRS